MRPERKLKFYDCQTAPSPRRARIFIAEKGLDIETVEVDLMNKAHLEPWFQEINPQCTVPVLTLDDGTHIAEVTAIWRYLEDCFPEPSLLGRDPKERALVEMWNRRMESDGFHAIAEAFRNAAPGLKGRAMTGMHAVEQIPELAERGRARTLRFLDSLDRILEDRDYIAGETFTAADITAGVSVDFARRIKLGIPDGATRARRWYENVSARASWSK